MDLFVKFRLSMFSFATYLRPNKQSAHATQTFELNDACLPANDAQDRKFPTPVPYALKARTPAVVISKFNKVLMPSHLILFGYIVVLGTSTTVTRTPQIP